MFLLQGVYIYQWANMEACVGPCQISIMKRFAKVVTGVNYFHLKVPS